MNRHKSTTLAAALLAGLILALFAPRALAAETEGGAHGDTRGSAAAGSHGDAHGAAAAHGSTQAETVHNWFGFKDRSRYTPIGWAIVNFVILIFLLVKFAGKPFSSYLKDRHDEIRKQLDEAARLRAEAQRKLTEIETKVRNLDQEIAGIKKAVAEDAERERTQIIAAAAAEAERQVRNAERTLAEEVKRVHRELEVEAVEAAMAAAEKLLKQQVNEGDQQRINTEYLTGLSMRGGN